MHTMHVHYDAIQQSVAQYNRAHAYLFIIWQEVIGSNDVLVELLDDAVPVDTQLASIPGSGPPQIIAR